MMKQLLLLLPLLLAAELPVSQKAVGSVYADLFEKTVTGKNDSSPLVEISNGSETLQTTNDSARVPPGTKNLSSDQSITVPMDQAGFAYYMNQFHKIKKSRSAYRKSQPVSQQESLGCPPGKRIYQKTALFGLIKGAKLCLSDYEAESLRQTQVQNEITNMNQTRLQNAITNMNRNVNRNRIINCTSNAYGSYRSITCF